MNDERRLRLLIAAGLYPPDIGGPATYAKTIIHAFAADDGMDVAVVPFGEVRSRARGIRHAWYLFSLIRAARRADILYALDPVSVGLPALFAALVLRRPYIVRIAGDYAWEQGAARCGITDDLDGFLARRRYPFFVRCLVFTERLVAAHARAVIVPSKYLESVVRRWGIPKDKIKVIYNGIETHELAPERLLLRKLLPLRERLLVTAGRFVPWKGFTRVVEAMARLREKFPSTVLLVVGEGPCEGDIEQTIQKKRLEGCVRMTGKLDRRVLHSYIKMADAFVLNTGYEGFSHQILEAMALGTPVITTRIGGNRELIEHGREGLLFDYNNTDELVKVAIRLLRDESLGRQLARNARAKVGRYTVARMIDETREVIVRAVEPHTRARP